MRAFLALVPLVQRALLVRATGQQQLLGLPLGGLTPTKGWAHPKCLALLPPQVLKVRQILLRKMLQRMSQETQGPKGDP